jgi:hypothetical protein
MEPIDSRVIERKCEEFLHALGVPGFIVFGWQKSENEEFGVVSSYHEVPPNVAVKAMTWALNDFAHKTL